MRALEVCLVARRPVTEMFLEGRDRLEGFRALKLGLAPEVQQIRGRGFSLDVKPFESHGYRQAVQLLRGELNLKEAISYAQRNTRNYAKRQLTWFRKEPDMEWLKGFGEESHVQHAALARAREFLTTS